MSTIFKFGYLPIFLMACCFDSIASQPVSSDKEEEAAYKRIQLLDPIEDSSQAPAAKKPSLQGSAKKFPPLYDLNRRLALMLKNNFGYEESKYPYIQSKFDQEAESKEKVVESLLRKLICWTCDLSLKEGYEDDIAGRVQYIYRDIFLKIEKGLKNKGSFLEIDDAFLSKSYCCSLKKMRPDCQLSPDALAIPEQLKEWSLAGTVSGRLENFKKLFKSSSQEWIKGNLKGQQPEQIYTAMFETTERYLAIPFFKKEFVEAIEANFDDPELGGAVFLLPLEEYEFIAKEIAKKLSLDKQKS